MSTNDAHVRRAAVGGLLLSTMFALAVAATGPMASSADAPQGTPIHDPELATLLRPSAGVVEDHITQGKDGEVYYSATLKHFAWPGFTKAYLAELEDRGLRIKPIASSPHAPPQHIIGYDLIVWQEASLDPYSIRFREGNEREDISAYEKALPPNYPHPVSVRLDRLVVRLPAEFAEPWKTAVVVPTENQVKLPYPVPLPADAVVRGVTQDKYAELINHEWQQTSVRLIRISILSRMAPEDVSRFFKQALEGWGRVDGEQDGMVRWLFDRIPSWAPPLSQVFDLDPQTGIYATPGGKGISDASHASPFQAKTLPHLPKDVRHYWITLFLKKEAAQ